MLAAENQGSIWIASLQFGDILWKFILDLMKR